MTHRRAVWLMVFITLLWSMAGVVTRHLDAARSFEVTFWRSLFTAISLLIVLSVMRGLGFWRSLPKSAWPVWVSGVCWSLMYTAFMLALTMTTVANVLVTLAIGPLITALFSRFFLGHRLPARTWLAIVLAGGGIGWMFGREALTGASVLGSLVAMIVPLAAASNWTVLQSVAQGARHPGTSGVDMLPAIFIGAVLSTLGTFPLAWPLQASTHDIGLLALLGAVQLALPSLLVVRLSSALPAAEISLLGLLEVLFGVTWAWLWAAEIPSAGTLIGGALVISALLLNEVLALLWQQRRGTLSE